MHAYNFNILGNSRENEVGNNFIVSSSGFRLWKIDYSVYQMTINSIVFICKKKCLTVCTNSKLLYHKHCPIPVRQSHIYSPALKYTQYFIISHLRPPPYKMVLKSPSKQLSLSLQPAGNLICLINRLFGFLSWNQQSTPHLPSNYHPMKKVGQEYFIGWGHWDH